MTPVVGKANAGLDSFEKKAESSHGKVIRISDQTRSSVQRLIASLEKQAEVYGKSGVDRLIAQRDQLLQRYAKEPAAIDAITKSYEKMIAAEEQVGTGGSFEGFAAKVKQFIENPISSAKGAMSSMLSAMGPWGMAIAAGAAVLGSIAVAGFEAAKSLGEYGLQIKNVELRTGLTSKEVGQFGFAARMAGQDVSIFERVMKGLSQATSENSQEGEKAKSTLKSLGIELRNTATGELKPTAQLFESIATGLAKLPEGVQRDAAAMDLFKKAGIEAIPVIEGLTEHIKRAKELGLGASEADLKRWEKYHEAVTEVEIAWGRLKRIFAEPLAAVVTFFLRDESGRRIDPQNFRLGPDGQWSRPTPGRYDKARAAAGFGKSNNEIWQENSNQASLLDYLGKVDAHKRTQAAISAYEEGQGLAGRLKRAENALAKMTKPEDATTEKQVADYAAAEKQVERLKDQIDASKHAAQQAKAELTAFRHAAAEFEKKGDEAELSAIEKIYYQRDLLLKQAAVVKASEAEIAAVRKAADEQAGVIYRKSLAEFEKFDVDRRSAQSGKALSLMEPSKDQLKDWQEGFTAQERIEDIGVQARRAELQRRANRAARMAELTGGSDEEVAQRTYEARISLALQLADIEAERISKEDNSAKKSVLAAEAQRDLFTALSEAQDQFDEKQAQMQQKREQALQSQIDGLQKQAERLFDTLFTKPKDFGRDLANTIHSAVLKPVTETLSKGAANLLHPLIYGSDGNGGLNGLFNRQSQDPVRVSTDQNTAATLQNSAAMAGLTAILAASMGVAAPQVTGGMSGISGMSAPAISMPATMPSLFGGGAPSGLPGVILSGFGQGSGNGVSPSWSGGGNSSVATPPFFPTGGTAHTGGGGFNLGGTFSNLKSSFWNNDIYTAPGRATTAAGIGGLKGDAAAVLTSQGAAATYMAAGMPLSMAGLTGSRRGTWGGIAESTGGGALVGAGIGTMIMPGIGTAIGAGIGAAAAFATSAAEKLFGVKSLEQTAHDDIKSIYGVDVPTNSGVIKQIVEMAKSQYGGSISTTVRSPNVRQLIMLYAEGTGQKMPLSATTPYGGSLVEQGGRLYQQATYQGGQAYTYASNIPTLGGISASTYPTPGGPNTSGGAGATYLSLNISGADAANFMTGQFVTPQFVADQSVAAQNSSYGRTQQSANMQLPGLTVA